MLTLIVPLVIVTLSGLLIMAICQAAAAGDRQQDLDAALARRLRCASAPHTSPGSSATTTGGEEAQPRPSKTGGRVYDWDAEAGWPGATLAWIRRLPEVEEPNT